MKATHTKLTAMVSLTLLALLATAKGTDYYSYNQQSYSVQTVNTSLRFGPAGPFHNTLAGDGLWLLNSNYGWVWRPAVAAQCWNWHPRTNGGIWIQTNAGLLWQPLYTWGLIVYEQGDWVQLNAIGWVWVPPCAPCAPAGTQISISFESGTHHRYNDSPHQPAPHPTQHYSEPAQRRSPDQAPHYTTPTPPPVAPTRRTQRITTVAKSEPKPAPQKAAPAQAAPVKTTTPSTSRSSRSITVIRSK